MFEIKEDLTTNNILKRTTEFEIFKFYCKNFKAIGQKFSAETRSDSIPSCVISEYNKKLWFKDFGTTDKAVDCFNYVMRKFNMTFLQALGIINLDLNLGLKQYVEHNIDLRYIGLGSSNKHTPKDYLSENQKIKFFYPQLRSWLSFDLNYWKHRYYIDINRAEKFGIKPVTSLTIKSDTIRTFNLDFPSYSYLVDWDKEINYYKIYSPFSKTMKWLTNCKQDQYLGFNYLPWVGDKVVITKSLKDIVVLSLFDLPAISPQSESQIISYEKYINLKKRFNKLYVLYDNDKAGRKGAVLTNELYSDIIPVFIPEESGKKDISDFIDKYRYKETNTLIKKLFYE